MKNIYKDMYRVGSGDDRPLLSPRVKTMLHLAAGVKRENSRILDIGCRDGFLLASLKGGNLQLHGIEASDAGVDACRRRGIRVVQDYIDDEHPLSFETGFFDLIIAGEIIEHIFDTDHFLDEIYRLLKPSGHLIITTPNIASLGRRFLLLLGMDPIIETTPNEKESSGHIRYFTFASLRRLLEKHEFRIMTQKSDVVNLSADGRLASILAANVFPGIGQSVIYLCRKQE